MESPLSKIASSYIAESTNDTVSDDQKKRALEVIEKFMTDQISERECILEVRKLIGTSEAATKIVNIIRISKDPGNVNMPYQPTKSSCQRYSGNYCSKQRSINGRTIAQNWSAAEDQRLLAGIFLYGLNDWQQVCSFVGNGRTRPQCSQRWLRCLDPALVKGPWTPQEDELLLSLVCKYGEKNWKKVASMIDRRSDAMCRYHYRQIKKSMISENKDDSFSSRKRHNLSELLLQREQTVEEEEDAETFGESDEDENRSKKEQKEQKITMVSCINDKKDDGLFRLFDENMWNSELQFDDTFGTWF